MLGPDPEIPDLLQDVMVSALSSIQRLDDPRALRSWLTRIAVFTARVRIAVECAGVSCVSSRPTSCPSPASPRTTRWPARRFARPTACCPRLTPDDRIAFALRYVDGMELTEVASATQVSLATIKRRLSRAQQRFQELAREEPALVEWVGGKS